MGSSFAGDGAMLFWFWQRWSKWVPILLEIAAEEIGVYHSSFPLSSFCSLVEIGFSGTKALGGAFGEEEKTIASGKV